MAIYITQGKYSASALKGLVNRPEDRLEQVRGLIERGGGKLLGYYVTLGEYDWMTIYENDDPLGPLAGLAISGATGAFSDMKTVRAYTSAEAKQAFDQAHGETGKFKAPGAS